MSTPHKHFNHVPLNAVKKTGGDGILQVHAIRREDEESQHANSNPQTREKDGRRLLPFKPTALFGTSTKRTKIKRHAEDSSFCCCMARIFLLVAGLVGFCIFLIATICCSTINFEMNKEALDETQFKGAYYLLLCSLGLLAAANLLLFLGACCKNPTLICVYLVMDTFFTLALWTIVAIVIIGWVKKAEEEEMKRGEGAGAKWRSEAIAMGSIVYYCTCTIYIIILTAACSYKKAVNEEKDIHLLIAA